MHVFLALFGTRLAPDGKALDSLKRFRLANRSEMKKPLKRIALPVDLIERARKVAAWQDQTGAQFVRYVLRKEIVKVERAMKRETDGSVGLTIRKKKETDPIASQVKS
jgi:hypothetical protein